MESSSYLSRSWEFYFSVISAGWSWGHDLVSGFWSGLQWPHSVLIITVLFFSLCHKEFKSLVGRMLEVGPSGAKFHPQPPPQSPELTSEPKVITAELREALATATVIATATVTEAAVEIPDPPPAGNEVPLPNPIVFPNQMKIYENGIKYEVAGKSESEALEYILPRYAIYRALFDFEECYSQIFGGQLKLLQIMNQRGLGGISLAELDNLWALHQAQTKPVFDEWNLAAYLNYIRFKGLVIDVGPNVILSIRGKEFVSWLTQYGKPLDKPF